MSYNVLEGAARWTVLLVNPEDVKAITGRKTNRADVQRLAFLVRHDLLAGSFIPARAQRELRELTRARTALVRERARVVRRLEKVLDGPRPQNTLEGYLKILQRAISRDGSLPSTSG